ncbi:hypothetical protein LFM09_03150 [Lentzea alba]|uniref:hypothetical protein n=1 Tax=Lentzea alba TaxID=2714351 RepID=UPI0039BF6E13
MELKEAMEAATADLDVRPGFVGDVMAGARRRHTRKLLAVTAAIALVAGVTTGVVLTRSPEPEREPLTAADPRLTAATSGDLAGDAEYVRRSLATWGSSRSLVSGIVTEVSTDAHVFWAANTPNGPASLIAQSVRVRGTPDPQTLVGMVHDGVVVDQSVAYQGLDNERSIYRLGTANLTYVVMGLGQRVFWSVNPVRGPDQRYSREWREAEFNGGVAVVNVKPEQKAVFVRTNEAPAAQDFTRQRLVPLQEIREATPVEPRPGLGWKDVMWASKRQEPSRPASSQDKLMSDDLVRRGYLDYDSAYASYPLWEVRAWLPDGRFAVVLEMSGELIGGLYQADGTFDRVLLGGTAVKGAPLPVRVALPDGQGTILAERGALVGPEEQRDAWLAPPGTTEVSLVRSGNVTSVVPL